MLLTCYLAACQKNAVNPQSAASLIIVNAIPGAAALVPNFYNGSKLQYYKGAKQITANSFVEFGGYTGNYTLSLSQFTDTLHTVYKGNLLLAPATYQTLFITGTLAAPDSVLTHDNIKAVTDSAVNVRFVNVSTNSLPVSINLQGSQASPLVTGLPYRGATAFIPFVVKKGIPASGNYVFEIRDVATAKLLTTYTLSAVNPNYIFKSVTVAFKGVPGGTGTNAQGTILVKHF